MNIIVNFLTRLFFSLSVTQKGIGFYSIDRTNNIITLKITTDTIEYNGLETMDIGLIQSTSANIEIQE